MANKKLFSSLKNKMIPATDARNEEGAPAYGLSPEAALAQYAATGCLNTTYYAAADEQLGLVLQLAEQVETDFLARVAVYSREQGNMKDMPALLCAVLSVKDQKTLARIFHRVMDNGRMLRNFVQILRSGAAGRKSLGTGPKRLVREWLEYRGEEALFKASVGNDPSLADVVKMVHPKPKTKIREAFYGYLVGREFDPELLPDLVRHYEKFKQDLSGPMPDVPFEMLTALELGPREWKEIARNAGWQMTRMNLNTFIRHGVFTDQEMVRLVAQRLGDREAIKKARVFPYQLLIAYKSAGPELPQEIRESLQEAMETATENVPAIAGQVYVCPDVSGSMSSPITGRRRGSTSAVRCIDVAALAAASILRQNPQAQVLPFENDVVNLSLNPRDSIMTNADKLAGVGGGGTNCSAPLTRLNKQKAKGELVVFISDNESWVDAGVGRGTQTMHQWNHFQKRNPQARLVCIDIQPYRTTQAQEREDIMNIGGFSDQVFGVISLFAAGRLGSGHWLEKIKMVEI
ncbi:MAG: TROVE domain-containing protein [Thermodesulfobacteriota bacterium]